MQTNGDVASLFSVVRLPGVGPEAAWNLSSLDPAWGEGQFLLIYLAKQTHVPPTLALKRGCTAVAPLPLPRPSPLLWLHCTLPRGLPQRSEAGAAGAGSARSACSAAVTRGFGPEIRRRVPSVGARGSPRQRRRLAGKPRPVLSPLASESVLLDARFCKSPQC